ncbi:MAG: DUF1302 domain-containing protein [Gammaproteobacteria bacterium]
MPEYRTPTRSAPSGLRAGGSALVWLAMALLAGAANAADARVGPVDALLDVTLSYGMLYRTEGRNKDLIAIANGGNLPSANGDDGDLNYNTGIVSNMVAATGELDLSWGNFDAFARSVAFYDYEQEHGNRPHRQFDGQTLDAVGSNIEMRDYFVGGQFNWAGLPVQLRIGNQVITWGEVNFVRDGVDTINPIDLVAAFQPARERRDARTPQGMAWGVAQITETFAVEGFYQYDWQRVRLPPPGTFFSTNDLIGEGGLSFATIGRGQFSDLGTDLDTAYDLPPGTLGFDANYFKYPELFRDDAEDGGQYGLALMAITQGSNALKVGLHYIRYHSRLPLIGTMTADQDAIDATSQADVDAVAATLEPIYLSEGFSPEEAVTMAGDTAGDLVTNAYVNQAGYFTEYPEDIDMIGLTFNTATLRTGTLLAAEISHHKDFPFQIALNQVYDASLSPVEFDDRYKDNALGVFGADQRINGYVRLDRTQVAASATQLFGHRLGASQVILSIDGAYIHIHDFPGANDVPLQGRGGGDENSWGYRILGQMEYTSVFGGLNVLPRLLFTHDVQGYTPAPVSSFSEERKSFSVGLGFSYINRWEADLSYTSFFDGEPGNQLIDRDFVRLQVRYGL